MILPIQLGGFLMKRFIEGVDRSQSTLFSYAKLEASMKGRKPLSQSTHSARGSAARIGHNRAVGVTSGLLAPPDTLTDAARDEWSRIAPAVHAEGTHDK